VTLQGGGGRPPLYLLASTPEVALQWACALSSWLRQQDAIDAALGSPATLGGFLWRRVHLRADARVADERRVKLAPKNQASNAL